MATQNYGTAPGRRTSIIGSAMASPMAQTRRRAQQQQKRAQMPRPPAPVAAAPTPAPVMKAPQTATSNMARKKVTF